MTHKLLLEAVLFCRLCCCKVSSPRWQIPQRCRVFSVESIDSGPVPCNAKLLRGMQHPFLASSLNSKPGGLSQRLLFLSFPPPVLCHPSSRSPSGKLLQIRSRRNTQDKSPPLIRNDRKLLLSILSILPSIEEQLQFL
jgi:hypothetical protein